MRLSNTCMNGQRALNSLGLSGPNRLLILLPTLLCLVSVTLSHASSDNCMTTDAQARTIIIDAFEQVMGRSPTLYEAQFAQATARYESHYGDATFILRDENPPHEIIARIGNTHNWGAVHCAHRPPCKEGCFEATDTRANGTYYRACFRRNASAIDGASLYIRTFYKSRPSVLSAANSGSIPAVAQAIHSTSYSEASPARLEKAITSNLQIITQRLQEPMPTPKRGVPWRYVLIGGAIAGAAWYMTQPTTAPQSSE